MIREALLKIQFWGIESIQIHSVVFSFPQEYAFSSVNYFESLANWSVYTEKVNKEDGDHIY